MAIGTLVGGTGALAGCTVPLLANDVLQESGSQTMRFFSTFSIAMAMCLVAALCYWFFLEV